MQLPTLIHCEKIAAFGLGALLLAAAPRSQANLVGPYTPDANTLFLLHCDEAAGSTVTANSGTKGGNFYAVNEATATATPPVVTTMLGAAGYVNGPTNFNTCLTNPTTGYVLGYDFNNSGAYQGDASGSSLSADALAMTNLNIGLGGQSPFTIEALIRPTTITAAINQEIIATDSSAGSRAFQFRITTAGQLNFQFINGSQAISGTIPTTGPDAFVAGNWYHVAITYNGSIATLYWTKLDPANGAAHVLSTAALTLGTTQGNTTGPLCIGNENRNTAGEQFLGSIDEVRISSVARGSGEMQFYSPLVTITANPVSQNVDYNQPVTFIVGASSQFALNYQWRFNSNFIAGATSTSFIISNVAAANAGYYDCVVTNTAGYAATSSPALLVVGAANFLGNRYSFTTDTSDSIGGQWGTNFGNATIAGGKLVLDGSTDTCMQLPGNLFNGGNATALTVEFWATYGANPNFAYTFAFGVTNFVIGSGIVGFNHAMFCSHTGSGGQTASATPGDPQFAQTVNAGGTLDGQTVHVAVVFDPPNKMLSIYTNGVLEAVNTNFTVNISSLNDQLSYIGKSLWPNDPYLNASIDELRIFRGALSPLTIKQSQDQGPNVLLADGPAKFVTQPANATVPQGWVATFSASTVGYLPITYQWFKNNTLVPGATNASYAFVATTGDNGASIKVYATNTIGVTTYVTNSTTATLTVSTPPTLSWLGAANGGADNNWNISSLDWTNVAAGGGVIAFPQISSAVFDSRGSGSSLVELTETINPYTITANNASGNDYVLTSSSLTGSLVGQGSITKAGAGKLTLDVTNNLSGPTTISGGILQIGNNSANGSLGSGVVTNNGTLSFSRVDTALNVANVIHGSGTMTFDGGGTVTVSGASDYTGSTLINLGIVNLQSSTGLGATSGGTTVTSSGQLYLTANVDVAEPLIVNGVGDGNGALRKGGAGVSALTAPVTLGSDTTIGLDGGATLALSNVLAGPYAVTATGNGTLALDTNNTFTGGVTLLGAIVNLNANRALGSGPVTVGGAGRFVLGDGLTVTNAFVANTVSPGVATGLLMVNNNTNGVVTTVSGPIALNALAANGGHFAGPIASGYLNVSGPVTMPGAGNGYILLVRLGNVRFSGSGSGYDSIEVREGTTSLGANNAIATTAVLDLAGNGSASFDLNGFHQTLAGLKNTVGPANLGVITNSSATLRTLTLDLGAGGYSFGGNISGNLGLTLMSGTQTLTGTNNYTGNTTVNGGVLQLATATLATSATVLVTNGAILQMDFPTTNQVAGLVLNGVSQPAGVYNSTTSPAYLAGQGSLRVQAIATNPTNITAVVSGGQYDLSWPASHTGWRLQSQTNSLSVGLSGTWFDVAGSTATNHVIIPINPANGSVFFRLAYP